MDRWDAADLGTGPHAGSYGSVRVDGHGRQVEAIERVHVGSTLEERRTLSEYLPTGELRRIIQRRAGSSDIVRWLRYDSLGRLVLNVEPNTSVGFNPNPDTDPTTIKAWRYAYSDAGDLVGTSDARGCGVNYYYDSAGRLTAEDHSPCLAHHASYTTPNFTAQTGIEAVNRYDTADPETGTIEDAADRSLEIDTSLLWGRAVSVSDLGSKRVTRYDALGRVTGTAVRLVKPGPPAAALADRYAPRWYIKESVLDAADRALETSTGASSPELLGGDGRSVVAGQYSARGLLKQSTSSYGTLLASQTVDANGLPRNLVLGDAAATQRSFDYDDRLRLHTVQTYRATPNVWSNPPPGYSSPALGEPTQQLLLEDYELGYDAVDNVTTITDWRPPADWPASAKPVSRSFQYDDSYRLTQTLYDYGGTDNWSSPFAAENASLSSVANEPKPSPHIDFSTRVVEQTYTYDYLGNIVTSADNSSGFYDRSLGGITHGLTTHGPHQLQSATNRISAPTSARKGDLSAAYDAAGELTDLIVRRDGPCVPAGASCWQRFHYQWDEVGNLSRARRWDLAASSPNERDANGDLTDPLPTRAPDAELSYAYTSGDERVLKTAVDPFANERHTVYIFSSLELRSTTFVGAGPAADYLLSATTENVRLNGGVSARLVYSEEDLPALVSGGRHVFLELSDYLGSNTFVVDHATGELVEYATYQAYGATESNYRPERWGSFREPYKFAGKEEDVEVGLAYFGARYLSLGLGRWMSPDAATVHGLQGDLNPYAYVHGRPTVAVDPDGNFAFLAVLAVAIVVSAVANAATQANENGWSNVNWGGVAVAAVAGGAGAAVGGPLGSWVGGALAGTLGTFAAGAIGASIGSGVGAGVGYGVGIGTNNALAGMGARGMQSQSASWSGLGTAVGTGALAGPASYATGSALASSGAGRALTASLSKALGPTAGSAVSAGVFGAAGGVAASGVATATTGGKFDASSALIAASAAGASAGVSAAMMSTRATDPTRGDLSKGNACSGPECGGPGVCFVAGTLVATAQGRTAIEKLQLGNRVEVGNPACAEEHLAKSARTIHLAIPNPDAPWDVIAVDVVRPLSWLEAIGLGRGPAWVELSDIGAAGLATVTGIDAAPPEEPGTGCLVLSTIRHVAERVLTLTLTDGTTKETLELTPPHRLFVEGRGWTVASALKPGDRLRSDARELQVEQVVEGRPHRMVYNIEVGVEHAYRVGQHGLWAHNACPNPDGSRGGPAHRATIERRIEELKAQRHEHLGGGSLPEERIPTPGGAKTFRRPDITTRAPDGTIYRENVGRSTSSGRPVAREVRALDDIDSATGQRPGFTPYDR